MPMFLEKSPNSLRKSVCWDGVTAALASIKAEVFIEFITTVVLFAGNPKS